MMSEEKLDSQEEPQSQEEHSTSETSEPTPTPLELMPEEEAVPEGMIRAFNLSKGDLSVGLNPEVPDSVVFILSPADAALVIPLEVARSIHDSLCASIAMLESDEYKSKGSSDSTKWN